MGIIVDEGIAAYLRGLAPERPGFMLEMEKYASENYVSIIPPEVAQLLTFFANLVKARNVLEIGTAIAYSTIWLAWAIAPRKGHVTTIEINERRAVTAAGNIREAGLEEYITLLKGHAVDIVPDLKDKYDLIFIDAARGQYGWFFDQLYPRLAPGGLLISDNVLAEGLVVVPDDQMRHRKKTAVRKLRDYVKMLTGHPGLQTTIIPMSDGIAVSLKK